MMFPPAALLAALIAAASYAAAAQQASALWGEAGELWEEESGPMDFSYAGAPSLSGPEAVATRHTAFA